MAVAAAASPANKLYKLLCETNRSANISIASWNPSNVCSLWHRVPRRCRDAGGAGPAPAPGPLVRTGGQAHRTSPGAPARVGRISEESESEGAEDSGIEPREAWQRKSRPRFQNKLSCSVANRLRKSFVISGNIQPISRAHGRSWRATRGHGESR